ncbi:Kelch repeat-containing protein [Bacillus safensis]|uniref:Kelch repeat-containing protein n=1 Tax=Bacillus safensis TaxID=561879 RepID=UPI00240DE877|nr:kelch repeat-containing protein [Bacillus safensis]WEZ15591.1 kelch repeat-containing protein [Bacillus safensis]
MKKGLFLVLLTIFMMVTIHPLKAHAAETNGWTKRADLPEERIGASVGVVEGKIYVFGGASQQSKFNNSTYMYDPKIDLWSEKASMPRLRTGAAYATVGKKIYVIGGLTDTTKTVHKTIDVYDTELDQWTEEPIQMPEKFIYTSYINGSLRAVTVGEKIYIVASLSSSPVNFYSYDTVSGEWESLDNSQLTSRQGRSIAEINGKLYIAGGEANVSRTNDKDILEYDMTLGKWQRLKDIQLNSFAYEAAYATYNHQLFMIGGQRIGDRSSKLLKQVQIFDPQTSQVKDSLYEIPEGRVGSVAAIADDQLYVIGGRDYAESIGSYSVKNNFKSVISISLKDLQKVSKDQDETKPGDGTSEEPKDQDGTKPDDGTTEEPKTEEPKDQDGTKPGDGTTEEPKDQDGTKPGDGTTEEPKDQDGTKPGEEATKGILSITMINGLQKDYLLSMKEINDFLNWYKERSFGIGMNFYEINDEHNKGPFTSKKDYVVYQNILMFDIKQY